MHQKELINLSSAKMLNNRNENEFIIEMMISDVIDIFIKN